MRAYSQRKLSSSNINTKIENNLNRLNPIQNINKNTNKNKSINNNNKYENKYKNDQRYLKQQIKKLTIKSKQLYPLFNIQHLQLSRLNILKGYQQMIQQLLQFNQELQKWKLGKHQIRNLVVTYHLYTNLYSRLRFISVFSTKQEEAINSINQTIKWFAIEKPQKRNYVPQTKAQIKPRTIDIQQDIQQNQHIQFNVIKQQLKSYENMSRTCHNGFFPPKDRLKEYRRKQLVHFLNDQIEKSDKYHPMSAAKTTATSSFNKFGKTYRDSLASRNSFKQTKQTFKFSNKKDSIPEQKYKDVQIDQFNSNLNQNQNIKKEKDFQVIKEDQNKQKQVNQEEIVQDSIPPKKLQQNQKNQQGQNLLQQQSQEQDQPQKELKIKKYAIDHDPQQNLQDQQKLKLNQLSAIRRVIKHKQQKIRNKIQSVDMKKNMNNWAKIKAAKKNEQKMKLEAMWHVNKFKNIQHRIIDPYNKDLNENKPFEYKMLYRSKSSHTGSIQSDIERIKIKDTLQRYGRHIQHGNFGKIQVQPEQEQFLLKYRGSLLTDQAHKITKNKHFTDILNDNNPQVYNQQTKQEIFNIKTTLSKNHIPIKNNKLYKSLAIPIFNSKQNQSIIKKDIDMFTNGKNLFSNPFFPKNLYQSSNKKKNRNK